MSLPHNLRGILAMVTAMGVFIANDTCMKLALADVPLFQLIALRGFAAGVLCLVLLVAVDQGEDIPKAFNPWLLARGLCEVIANFGFTFAIMVMAIADITAITQTCPLFVLLGARLLWGERLGRTRLVLIALGIAGALLVAQPGTGAVSPYALLGFVVAVAAAGRDLITRKVPSGIPALAAAFAVIAVLTAAGFIAMLAFETPVLPSGRNLLLAALAGVLMVCGHICIFLAYRIGPTRTVAPFMYSLIIWAVLAGVLVFGDIPNLLAIAGMALVSAAGLAIVWLDGQRRPAAA